MIDMAPTGSTCGGFQNLLTFPSASSTKLSIYIFELTGEVKISMFLYQNPNAPVKSSPSKSGFIGLENVLGFTPPISSGLVIILIVGSLDIYASELPIGTTLS